MFSKGTRYKWDRTISRSASSLGGRLETLKSLRYLSKHSVCISGCFQFHSHSYWIIILSSAPSIVPSNPRRTLTLTAALRPVCLASSGYFVFTSVNKTGAAGLWSRINHETHNRPGFSPAITIFFKARLFPEPFPAIQSLLRSRQAIHQHPPHAPRSPNSSSISRHRDGVAEWNFKDALSLFACRRCVNGHFSYVLYTYYGGSRYHLNIQSGVLFYVQFSVKFNAISVQWIYHIGS